MRCLCLCARETCGLYNHVSRMYVPSSPRMGMGMRIACHALQSGQGAATRKRGSRQDRRPHGAQADLAELRRRLAAAEVAAATNAAAAAAGAAHAAERRRAGGAGGEAGALRRELAAAQAGAQALRCERRQSADAAVALQSQVLELQAGKARSEAAAARLQRALVDLRADKAQQMGAGAAAAAQQERGVAAVVELQARRAREARLKEHPGRPCSSLLHGASCTTLYFVKPLDLDVLL